MKPLHRALGAAAVVTLATSGALLFGASAVQAYPTGVAVQAGGVSFNLASPPLATFTQSSPSAVVATAGGGSTLDIGVGETLNIVQSDPGMLMILRNTSALPLQLNGTVHADADLLIISPAGINVNGTITAGGDVILSTGDIDINNISNIIPLTPLVTNGAIVVGTTGGLEAGANAGIAGNDTTIDGTIHADGVGISIVSNDDVEYNREGDGSLPFITDGNGFVGGVIQTSTTASVTATGVVVVEATAPSTAALDGSLAADGLGASLGEGIPGIVAVIGSATSTDGQFDAVADGAGPAGGQLGAHLFGGDSVPFASAAAFQVLSYGVPTPMLSQVTAPLLRFFGDELAVGFTVECSTLEDPEDPESPSVDPYSVFALSGLQFNGGNVLPPGFDPDVANQAPVVVPGLGTIAVNEQSTRFVDGYSVITTTALHIVTPTDDVTVGVVECAQAVPAQLAATGSGVDGSPLIAGAAMMLLGGVLLVLRRRRATA